MSAAPRWHRMRVLLLLVGWTLATGAHWDVIQVATWGHMWARNAQVQPLGLALATTFSPEGMCSVCWTVQTARLEQGENPVLDSRSAGKAPLLLPHAPALVVECPVLFRAFDILETHPRGSLRAAPPVPPPRGSIAIG